jgi:hypothetical protein
MKKQGVYQSIIRTCAGFFVSTLNDLVAINFSKVLNFGKVIFKIIPIVEVNLVVQ